MFLQTSFAVSSHCHGVIQEAQREKRELRELQLTVRLWLVLPLSHLPSVFAELVCFVADRKSKFPHPKPFVNILPDASSGPLPSFTYGLQTVGDKLFADWWVAVGLLLCFGCVPWQKIQMYAFHVACKCQTKPVYRDIVPKSMQLY